MTHINRSILPHDVPNWIDATQEAFFITLNCQPRGQNQLATPNMWHAILETIGFREQRGDWKWLLILAMPDHLHGIVIFPQRFFLQKSMADWKRWLATQPRPFRWNFPPTGSPDNGWNSGCRQPEDCSM
jgi:hypothetical protein